MKKKFITAEEFDEKFDSGEDINKYLDLANRSHPGNEIKRINLDIPVWMINLLDREAKRLGVTRQSIIKFWLSDKIKKEQEYQNS
jgi:hypothetical protein